MKETKKPIYFSIPMPDWFINLKGKEKYGLSKSWRKIHRDILDILYLSTIPARAI